MRQAFQERRTEYRQTLLGRIGMSEERGALVEVFWGNKGDTLDSRGVETPLLAQAFTLLEAYLRGERVDWSPLPLAPQGTAFELRVWEELKKIPYGQTRTYGQIAALVGNRHAARAVGMANHRNPLPIIIPCHRVVEAGGGLGGYSEGVDIKTQLLRIEKILL